MTACRASRIGLAGGIALILAACAGDAAAQQGPIRLSPPRIGVEKAAETPPPAPEPAAAPAAAEEPARSEPKQPEIIVSDTPALNVDGVGLVDERSGGLPETLWKGSTRPVVDRLIALLPAVNTSPAARGLAERVLVSTGTAPMQPAGTPAGSFVAVRAERLLAMGRSTPAAGLARAVPQREDNEPLSRVLLDAALIEYDNAGACQIVRRRIGRSTTLYWQKALIFCQALAGEHDRAQLGLSLLREQRADDDPAFNRLVNALGGDQRPITDLAGTLGPLHLAMLRAARQQIPASAVERAEPTALRMIAQSPNTTIDTRLTAADRAEAAGALPTDALIQIFESVTIPIDDARAALDVMEKAPQPRAHAAIYRLAKAQSAGTARAEALARGWAIARTRGFFPAAARTTAPLLRELSPAPGLGWFAADAGRVLLLNGLGDEARKWHELARSEAAADARTDRSEVLLWPLLRIAGVDTAAPASAAVATWRAAQQQVDAAQMPARTAILTSLLEGFGDATDGSLSTLLLSGNVGPQTVTMPHPALWLGRDGAASAGRSGETALFVLASLPPEGAAGMPPQTLIALIQALRAVGLESDARALGLEAAIAAGL
jgi:hypothetical protein